MKKSRNLNDDTSTYLAIGGTFTLSGVVFLFSETSRGTAIPFLVMGCTFLALAYDSHHKQKRK